MFSDLDRDQKLLVYQGLIELVRSGSGRGFINQDQRHPVYRLGAAGRVDHQHLGDAPEEYEMWGDAPERNRLYAMISLLALELGDEAEPPVQSWEQFCALALDAYGRKS